MPWWLPRAAPPGPDTTLACQHCTPRRSSSLAVAEQWYPASRTPWLCRLEPHLTALKSSARFSPLPASPSIVLHVPCETLALARASFLTHCVFLSRFTRAAFLIQPTNGCTFRT